MAFADEIAKTNSERFSLVRLTVTRWASDDFVSLGGGLYEIANFPFPVAGVKRTDDNAGLELLNATEVSVTPTVDDTYQITASNSIIIKTATAPNTGETGEDIWYVDYYVFYSSSANGTRFTEDPTNASTAERLWEPRLIKDPTFTQTSDNTVFGIVTSKSSAIEVANQDGDFQAKYLGDTDSFFNKDCSIWVVVNGEVKLLFKTSVKSIDIGKTVSIRLYDPSTKLDQTATFGLEKKDVFWNEDIDDGTLVDQIDDSSLGSPIPLVIGVSSWHQIATPTEVENVTSIVPAVPDLPANDTACITRGQKAVAMKLRVDNLSTVTNRRHGICRSFGGLASAPGNALGASPSTIAEFGTGPTNRYIKYGNFTFGHAYQIGDTVHWKTGGNDYYGIVCYNKSFTAFAISYNLAIFCIDSVSNQIGTWTTSSVIQDTKSLGLILRSNKMTDATDWNGGSRGFRPLLEKVDFNVSEVTLDTKAANDQGFKSSQVFTYIDLVTNFEANTICPLSSPFDPKADSIEWRVGVKGSATFFNTHGRAAREFCKSAGLKTNDTSFTDAESAVTCNTLFQIPLYGERNLGTYRDYVGEICKAAGTYIKTDENGETSYEVLSNPVAGDSVTNDNAWNIRRRRVFSDIRPVVFASNKSAQSYEGRYYVDREFTSDKFRFLHGSDEQAEIFHVAVTGDSAGRAAEILRNRAEIYDFDAGAEFLEKNIGDSITLDVDESGGAKNLFIIGITKSAVGVKITARDFGELS